MRQGRDSKGGGGDREVTAGGGETRSSERSPSPLSRMYFSLWVFSLITCA